MDPIDRARRYAVELWQHEGKGAARIAKLIGASEYEVSYSADNSGFLNPSATDGRIRGKYSRGPCLECWKVRPRRQIHESRGWRCTVCIGYEDVRQGLPVDVRAERQAALARMAGEAYDWQGIQRRKPQAKRQPKGGKK